MKCLSVRQPWAWALLAGRATAEYRCWPTDYRGDLLLHASPVKGKWEEKQLATLGPGAPAWDELPFGEVIGVVELWDCQRSPEGEWVWMFRNPRPVRPFRVKGGPRLFDVPDRRVRLLSAG
jgi:hypothetical protein